MTAMFVKNAIFWGVRDNLKNPVFD